MRFFIAGLVLIALGLGVTEYQRRNPPPELTSPKEPGKQAPKAPSGPPPTTQALIESAAPSDSARAAGSAEAFGDLAPFAASSVADGFTTVLSGKAALRELKASGATAVVVLDKSKQSALLAVQKEQPPRLLAARPGRITALAVSADTVAYAEAGTLYRVPLAGGESRAVVTFPKAAVVSLALKADTLIAALVPKDADPFSTDANAAVMAVTAKGEATLLAGELVRPSELLVVGDDAFWIAGYPTGLYRAALDGSFSARIAERAAGPLAADGEGVVHRYPQTGAPEVRRVAPAGGSAITLARTEAELLTAAKGVTWYTTTGIAPHLYSVEAGGEAKDVLALKGATLGLAASEAGLFVLSNDDSGLATVKVRP